MTGLRLDAQSSWVALVSKVGSLASYRNSGRAAPVFTILWAQTTWGSPTREVCQLLVEGCSGLSLGRGRQSHAGRIMIG